MPTKKTRPDDRAPATESPLTISVLPDPAYWQALGQFIEGFALGEVGAFAYLAACAGIRNLTARALLSGARADQLIVAIRKVWQIKSPDDDIREKVDTALTQFKHISAVRNSAVHYASFVISDRGRITSNVSRALTREHVREFRISPEVMTAMITDLEKISHHLTYGLVATIDSRVSRDELLRDLPNLAASWQYKPHEHQPQSPPKRKRRDRR
jgi:hypothetical protein